MADVTGGGEIGIRATGYGMTSRVVDGNDLWVVREAALEAVARARAGEGPTLLECQTYRHYGHSKSDPGKYRPPDEVERWLARDPLDLVRARLLELGVAEDELAGVESEVDEEMDRAVEAALAAPYPDPERDAGTEYKG
jgi:acetoin:2,6-dichlorophenolindophenol oxidoreductase subunit alpha